MSTVPVLLKSEMIDSEKTKFLSRRIISWTNQHIRSGVNNGVRSSTTALPVASLKRPGAVKTGFVKKSFTTGREFSATKLTWKWSSFLYRLRFRRIRNFQWLSLSWNQHRWIRSLHPCFNQILLSEKDNWFWKYPILHFRNYWANSEDFFMLNDAQGFSRVFIATGYSDLRKGIDGLANIIKICCEEGRVWYFIVIIVFIT